MPTSSTSEQRRPTAQAAEALRVAAIWAAAFVAPRSQTPSGMLPRRASSAVQIDSQRGMRKFFTGCQSGLRLIRGCRCFRVPPSGLRQIRPREGYCFEAVLSFAFIASRASGRNPGPRESCK